LFKPVGFFLFVVPGSFHFSNATKKTKCFLAVRNQFFRSLAHYLRKRERGISAESNPLEILGCKAAGLKGEKA
jgi:hypothetical protein